MRIPKRKAEEDRRALQAGKVVYLTAAALEQTRRQIERIKASLPHLKQELQEAQAMGDLSENAAYSIAKANLRRAQGRILTKEELLKHAVVIEEGPSERVRLGSRVTIEVSGQTFTYQIVGEREADPKFGRISNESPLGNTLLGLAEGEPFELNERSGNVTQIQ